MNSRNLSILTGIFTWALVSTGAAGAVDTETKDVASKLGAKSATEVTFMVGSSDLTDDAKMELDTFIMDANKKGKIQEIKVISWADQEYPPKDVKLSKDEQKLAKDRANNIETYFDKKHGLKDVKTISMAERPNQVQRALGTPTAKTKTAMEQYGAAPTTDKETGLFGLKGKASHALILVYFK